jgi:predicted AAA+ superfamily ATPase
MHLPVCDPRNIDALAEAFVVYPAPRLDIKGKRLLSRTGKYYLVDPGLRTALVSAPESDTGRVLENIVYLELRRRWPEVYVGKVGPSEIDFAVRSGDRRLYVQVAQTLADPATRARELAPLYSVPDFHERLILTADIDPGQSVDGIRLSNVLTWLMEDPGPA